MLTQINKIYYIAENIRLKGKEAHVIDFDFVCPRGYWKFTVWPALRESCHIYGHGGTGVVLMSDDLEKFDRLIDEMSPNFIVKNKWKKTRPLQTQFGLFEQKTRESVVGRQKGFYRDISNN